MAEVESNGLENKELNQHLPQQTLDDVEGERAKDVELTALFEKNLIVFMIEEKNPKQKIEGWLTQQAPPPKEFQPNSIPVSYSEEGKRLDGHSPTDPKSIPLLVSDGQGNVRWAITSGSLLVDAIGGLLDRMGHHATKPDDIDILVLLLACLRSSMKRNPLPLDTPPIYPPTPEEYRGSAARLDPLFFLNTYCTEQPSRNDEWPIPLQDFYVGGEMYGKIDPVEFIHWAMAFRKHRTLSLFSPAALKTCLWKNLCSVIDQISHQDGDGQGSGEDEVEIFRISYTLRAQILWITARDYSGFEGPPIRSWLPFDLKDFSAEKLREMAFQDVQTAQNHNPGQKLSRIITSMFYAEFLQQIVKANLCVVEPSLALSGYQWSEASVLQGEWEAKKSLKNRMRNRYRGKKSRRRPASAM
jgi:hypothetical protein